MSDPYATRNQVRGLEQTRTIERSPLYLPWSQRIVNPFPLASSGGAWGDQVQPWAVNVLAFYAAVFVVTTNNGANFWTVTLADAGANVLAQVTTAAIAANVSARLSTITGIVQPSASNAQFLIIATATGAPGAIYISPSVALLRTGN